MSSITNELELYSLKGNVTAGKILLFNLLENRDHLSEDEIRMKVVDEYELFKPKHFIRSWKEYTKMKKFLRID
tara:strand:- start:240 stop:458 length:219 start_codon:yes stop_codon:yes gene_type:complete